MSLAHAQDRLQLPEIAAGPAPRVPPPGLDDQDGRGRRARRPSACGRVPGHVRRSTGSGRRPAWARARLLFVAAVGRLRACSRWPCTAGSGGNRRLEQLARLLAPEASRRSATSCWGSSSWSAATPSRPGRAALCEAAIRAGGRGRPAARFPRRRAASPASALGLAGRRARWLLAVGAAGALSRRRPRTPGSGCSPPGGARRATRSPRSSRCPTAGRRRTASRSRSRPRLRDETAWRPERGGGAARRAASGRRPAARRPLRVRAAAQIDPGWLDVKIGDASSASGSSRPCGPS